MAWLKTSKGASSTIPVHDERKLWASSAGLCSGRLPQHLTQTRTNTRTPIDSRTAGTADVGVFSDNLAGNAVVIASSCMNARVNKKPTNAESHDDEIHQERHREDQGRDDKPTSEFDSLYQEKIAHDATARQTRNRLRPGLKYERFLARGRENERQSHAQQKQRQNRALPTRQQEMSRPVSNGSRRRAMARKSSRRSRS